MTTDESHLKATLLYEITETKRNFVSFRFEQRPIISFRFVSSKIAKQGFSFRFVSKKMGTGVISFRFVSNVLRNLLFVSFRFENKKPRFEQP